MTALLQWMTANPVRAFLASGLAALLAIFVPMATWLPGSVVSIGFLAGGTSVAASATVGAASAFVWALSPVFGTVPAIVVALAVILPSALATIVLEKSRSLSVSFQALTIGSCLLVLGLHGLFGDPVRALAPIVAEMEPMFRQVASTLTRMGFTSTPEEIRDSTASMAWATFGWMILLQSFLAQCVGLWGYSRLREPGLFGREFRALRLGSVIAWLLIAVFFASLVANWQGANWQAVDDLRFVLAAAFLVQALAVVHGLRELQVIGVVPVVVAYFALIRLPMALVGIGVADTWVRFRERFAPRQGV